LITGQIRALLRRVQERGCFLHATHNALKVSSRKGCESALETRLRVSWPLSERSEPFMARFRVLGCVAKKRTRRKGEMVLGGGTPIEKPQNHLKML
jgi:hypothetical protein